MRGFPYCAFYTSIVQTKIATRRSWPAPGNRVTTGGFVAAAIIILLALAPVSLQAQVNVTGQWTTLSASMPVNPAHQALMKNGKVLIVAGNGVGSAPSGVFQAAVYDPSTQTVTAPQTIGWDMFCNEMVVLVDGRVYIVGGFGYTRTAVYDSSTGAFTELAQTSKARWYPSVIMTSTGNVLTIGGVDANQNTSVTAELFDGSSWSTTYGPAVWMPALYPRGHVLGNGKIFYSGWQTTSNIVDEITGQENLNVATTNFASQRMYGTSVLLPLNPPSYATKVLILGGNNPATATSELSSDLTQNQTTPTWTFGPSMAHARIELNGTILPDGTVLVTGGSTNDEDSTTAALAAELYNPSTNTFTSLASETYARLYHSTAILLPDATVMVAGSQPGLNANPAFSTYDTHIEIFKPPYLFNSSGGPATRPTITSVPANISYGQGFTIQTPDAANISKVVLMRPGSVTHAFNVEQRQVGLSFTTGSGVLNVTAPNDSVSTPTGLTNPAPPGYYMVFLVNSSGVPSVASFVQLKPPLTVSPINTAAGTSGSSTYTVTVGDSNAFAGGCVTPSLSGLPANATSSAFNPTSICGTGSSSVTVTEAASTPTGVSKLTFTGTSGSITHRTASAFIANATPATGTVTFSGSEKNNPGAAGTGSVTIGGPGSQEVCCDGSGNLEWDQGTVTITVNGTQPSTPFSNGSPCCTSFIANYLSQTINQSNAYVTASWDGANKVTLTAKTVGSGTNYPLSASATYWADCSYYDANNVLQSPCFTQPSFTATASGATLTGGRDTVYDTGTVSITVNGHRDNCPNYGQGSTPSSVASNCANTINGDSGAAVTASASGGVLTLTAKQAGLTGNSYALSVSIASSNGFSTPSFSASNPSSLSGGH
jgi:hypothetical protein